LTGNARNERLFCHKTHKKSKNRMKKKKAQYTNKSVFNESNKRKKAARNTSQNQNVLRYTFFFASL
jgi:hypothetical protein